MKTIHECRVDRVANSQWGDEQVGHIFEKCPQHDADQEGKTDEDKLTKLWPESMAALFGETK